ncbi:Uncharacterized protein TCM_023336 [Theobroma cacao]|uniref:Uncharacterized protein n=1 Tax=Theobroma cacao TaxID=3641 RepID=A0A061EUV2_THECC|nr:Uncharacterized protein TCM_023336 [Theobroma cacao]
MHMDLSYMNSLRCKLSKMTHPFLYHVQINRPLANAWQGLSIDIDFGIRFEVLKLTLVSQASLARLEC